MIYLLQVSTCWILFYLIYAIFLQKETFFSFNRYYLLGVLFAGLVVPYLGSYLPANSASTEVYTVFQSVTDISVSNFAPKQGIDITWELVLWIIYTLGALLAMSKTTLGLLKIYRIYKSGTKYKNESYTLVSTSISHLPFSFFHWVFVSKNVKLTIDMERILDHEKLHVSQWHSIDILFTELLQIFFWFNPILTFYKKALRQSHEFLADAYVTKDSEKYSYGQLLLGQSTSGLEIALANQFFNSQIKKRIKMMYKERSKKPVMIKYLAVIPVLAILLLVFSSNISSRGDTFDKEKVKEEILQYFDTHQVSSESIFNFVGLLSEKYPNQRDGISDAFDDLNPINGYTIDLSKSHEEHKLCVNWDNNIVNNGNGESLKQSESSWKDIVEYVEEPKKTIIKVKDNKYTINGNIMDASQLKETLSKLPKRDCEYLELAVDLDQEYKYVSEVLSICFDLGHKISLNDLSQNEVNKTEPLVVVDGVVKGRGQTIVDNINTDDITRVVVVKDEEAIKKYGDKGLFGVIEITIKNSYTTSERTENQVYKKVDEMPRFTGCEDTESSISEKEECSKGKMLEYLYTNLKYPEEAKKEGIEGMVVIQMTIGKKGNVQDAKIVRNLGGGCAEEALRVINTFPEWIPGKQDGKPVDVMYTVPIRFKLQDESDDEKKTNERNNKKLDILPIVYPNPSHGKFDISFKTPTNSVVSLKVVGVTGALIKEIYSTPVNNEIKQVIDITDQNTKVGFIAIEQDGKTYTEKVIQQ